MTAADVQDPAPASRSPLGFPVFRALWIATIVSNIGTWMHDVGAGWLMTGLSSNPLMVALVQAATTLPMFLFALPAGAMADIVDRRRLLLGAQCASLAAAAGLAILTWQGATTPALLLAVTALLGTAAALSAPVFQAIVPELVDRSALPDAIALNSLGVNIARAIGPALGGVVVAVAGPPAVFALNAVSVLAVLFVLLRWHRAPTPSALPPEHFIGAMKAGYRYARHAPALQRVLIRAVGFFSFGSAIWALLPLIARRELALDAGGYGALLGCMGGGAVLGALGLKRLRARVSPNRLSIGATAVFAGVILGLAYATTVWMAGAVMVVAGFAWISVLTSLNVAAQMASPGWVKARALAIYLLAFQGAMTLGSVVWGGLASRTDVRTALTAAAIGLVLALLLARRWPLPAEIAADLTPSHHWAEPRFAEPPGADQGPVLVQIEYQVAPERMTAFAAALRGFKTVRQRDGAIRWDLWCDPDRPGRVMESFVVESWLEHQRQHARVTQADRLDQETLNAFHIGEAPPRVRHLIAPPRR